MTNIDEIISQCEKLIKLNITSSSSEFKSWKNRTERYLYNNYGEGSIELKQFNKIIIQFYPYLEKTLCFIKSAQNKFANLVNIYIL